MGKKDISSLKKSLKINSKNISINKLYTFYFKEHSKDIINSEEKVFDLLEEDVQELYIENCKKILTGNIGEKLFELDFVISESEIEDFRSQLLYVTNEQSENKINVLESIAKDICINNQYDSDVIINFIDFKYWNKNIDNKTFLLCSVNKISPNKKAVKYDYDSNTFSASSSLELVVELKYPLQGFLFPYIEENDLIDHKLLYNNGKLKTLDGSFINETLNCIFKDSNIQQKEQFNNIIKFMNKEGIDLDKLQSFFEDILERKEIEEEQFIGLKDIKQYASAQSGIHLEDVEKIFTMVVGSKQYEFNSESIIPNFKGKSIKIENNNISLNLNPQNLKDVKQYMNQKGELFLVAKLREKVYYENIEIAIKDFKDICEE